MNKKSTSPQPLNMSNTLQAIDVIALDLFSPEVITQLQFGDWLSLSNISQDQLEQLPDKATRALVTAIALFQLGEKEKAHRNLKLAKEWGCPIKIICRILMSSVYNTLGKSALLMRDYKKAIGYFEYSLEIGTPGYDVKLLTSIRAQYQSLQIGLPVSEIKSQTLSYLNTKVRPYSDKSIHDRLHCILDNLIIKLSQEGRAMKLDGVSVFNGKDPFMAGKIALGLASWVTEYPSTDPITAYRCQQFGNIIELVQQEKNESWGIYFYLLAIKKLFHANLINDCLTPFQLKELKEKLSWHSFVSPTNYQLKDKPNNFYQVAYAIAQLRFQLGWEDASSSQALLDKMVEHYEINSGNYGFADETEGLGRYDRYSVLLIAEIAQRFREAGLPLTIKLAGWLRKSADLVLMSLNEQGDGFQYGRSIGAYGDTAFLEILSAAAWYGLLTSTESKMAYIFCCISTEKFINFWYDKNRGSVNLWEEGRVTDSYRGKHRILGENLTLLHQHIYTQKIWEQLGFTTQNVNKNEFKEWLKALPRSTLTWFSKGSYEYALFTCRIDNRVFNVPLVNGDKYHNHISYYPIPFSNGLVEATANKTFPQLIPKIILSNGQEIVPLAWYKNIHVTEDNDSIMLSWEQDEADLLGEAYPIKFKSLKIKTSLVFTHGKISRIDKFEYNDEPSIEKIIIEYYPHISTTKDNYTNKKATDENYLFTKKITLSSEQCYFETKWQLEYF